MLENKNPSKTPIKNLGEFALIDHITKGFTIENESSQHGIGDDAAGGRCADDGDGLGCEECFESLRHEGVILCVRFACE